MDLRWLPLRTPLGFFQPHVEVLKLLIQSFWQILHGDGVHVRVYWFEMLHMHVQHLKRVDPDMYPVTMEDLPEALDQPLEHGRQLP